MAHVEVTLNTTSKTIIFLSLGLWVPLSIHAEALGPDPTPDTGNFIDSTHDFLANSFYWPMAFVDHFFMSQNEEFESNQSFFRVIGNYTWVSGQGFQFRPQIRLRVRLKALQKKLSIIAFGENNNEASPDISANQQTETKLTRDNSQIGRDTTQTRVGLRYNMFEWFNSRFDADVVVSNKLFPEPSLRGRQIIYKSDTTLSRFTIIGFYKKDLRWGQNPQLDYSKQLGKRWACDATIEGHQSQTLPELEWDSSANLNYLLSVREAMALRFQAIGPTRPHAIATNYRTSVVYRRNFYRSWMFYEVEPGIDWPYIDNHRAPVWSSAFRLELQFKSR